MAHRYTNSELAKMSDLELAISVLRDRANELQFYSSTATRIRRVILKLEDLQRKETKDDAARGE